MEIKIKYFNDKLTKLSRIKKGDWIDLRSSNHECEMITEQGRYIRGIKINKGCSAVLHLGVGMILPDGYEALIAPRSSTFRKYGIILTNDLGVIDNAYSGNNDEWLAEVYALRDTFIPFDERVFQFRIIENQPQFNFVEVDKLNDVDRGGFGSTGNK